MIPDQPEDPLVRDLIRLRERVLELEQAVGEKDKYEKELSQVKAMFEGLFEFAPDAIMVVDREGRIHKINKQAESLFGYTRAELLNLDHDILLVPERFRKEHRKNREMYIAAPRVRPMGTGMELYGRKKDGSEFPVDISLGPLPTQQGIIVLAVVRDFTERKRMIEAVNRANKELEHFAQIVSHDLQEPLRGVRGFLDLIQKQSGDKLDQKSVTYMQYAVQACDTMSELIRDLLSYSRIPPEDGLIEPMDLNVAVDRALGNCRAAIEESDAKITREQLPTLTCDVILITQLFQNLFSNALKFRRAVQPEIHIGVHLDGDKWLFAVQDNGIGIRADQAERIFHIFQRLHTRREYPGTGVGLAFCKKIVERYGGRIWVESRLAQGSTFFFTLPAT